MQQISLPQNNKYSQLAITATKLYSKNKIKEANKSVKKLLTGNSPSALHLFQTGVAAYNAGATDASIKLYERALTLPPTAQTPHADIRQALGLSYNRLGKIEEAIEHYDKGLELSPQNALIMNNRALAYSHIQKMEDALADLRQAFAIMPQNPNILINLVHTLKQLDQTVEATEILEKNISYHQENPDILVAIGGLKKEHDPLEALTFFRKAAYLDPKSSKFLNLYADCFERVANLVSFEGLDQDLLLLLSNDTVHWKKLNRIIPRHLKSKPAFAAILPLLSHAIKQNQDANIDFGKVTEVLTDNVLLAALKRIRLADAEIEKLLELFRRQSLAAIISDIKLEPALSNILLAILIPLAHYCFATEFIFSENEFEQNFISKVTDELEITSDEFSLDTALKFVIACCYLQPYRSDTLISLAKKWGDTGNPALNGLIKQTITEPLEEFEIRKTIPQLTKIDDAISLSVREQYEENPYPRWIHFPYLGSSDVGTNLASVLPVLNGIKPVMPKNPEVLIAGCGTGQQPISTALAYPDTKLLAVDLSLASIAYAKRKTNELGLKNISYGQADIMELRSLDRKFDIIECAGVLHHMHDPQKGWQVLCDLLKDDGFMLIGLYSEIGRRDIVAAREFIQTHGYGSDIADIRKCRKDLLAQDEGNLARQVLRHGDFYAASACRDLIFHVQEHRFTIPLLVEAFEQLNLEFLGFTVNFKHQEEAYKRTYPDDKNMNDLDNWNQFEEENPDLFSGMYKFWVRKKR